MNSLLSPGRQVAATEVVVRRMGEWALKMTDEIARKWALKMTDEIARKRALKMTRSSETGHSN